MMALQDCFSGCHQIWIRKEDEEKTSFITPFGTYCYLRKPEGPHNTSPMFCRMTKEALKDQVGRNVLSYVNDIVVASKKKDTYISDMAETFTNMSEAQFKLNSKNVYLELQGARSLVVYSQRKLKLKPSLKCNLRSNHYIDPHHGELKPRWMGDHNSHTKTQVVLNITNDGILVRHS
jgi:hypothetical protein